MAGSQTSSLTLYAPSLPSCTPFCLTYLILSLLPLLVTLHHHHLSHYLTFRITTQPSLLDSYDYAMHGRVFSIKHIENQNIEVQASFGGLLCRMRGEQSQLEALQCDMMLVRTIFLHLLLFCSVRFSSLIYFLFPSFFFSLIFSSCYLVTVFLSVIVFLSHRHLHQSICLFFRKPIFGAKLQIQHSVLSILRY